MLRRPIVLLLFVMLSTAIVLFACSREQPPATDPSAWNLPSDLGSAIPRLEVLSLTGEVDRLDWLGTTEKLKTLTLRETGVTSLSEVPTSVRTLSVVDQRVDFASLPTGLTSLSIAGPALAGLPASFADSGLTKLRLDGPVDDLPPLPPHLEELALLETGLDLSALELPSTMVAVELSGHSIGSLRRFPTDVSSVVFEETALTDLSVLASSTRTLVLERNNELLLDPLPGLMVSLELNGGTGLSSTVDAELERLHLIGTWLGNAAYLPRSLVTLDLRTRANLRQVAARCPRLRHLTAHGLRVPGVAKIDDLPQLTSLKVVEPPERIETDRPLTTLKLHQVTVPRVQLALDLSQVTSFALTLTDLDSVELLGANGESLSVDQLLAAMPKLTELSLRNSGGERVPALPPTVRSLDLRGTRFASWPDRLPPALEELRLAGADVQHVPLQDSLTVLDISATGIELESLPSLPHLRELTVHPDQVQALGRLPALTALHVVPASDL